MNIEVCKAFQTAQCLPVFDGVVRRLMEVFGEGDRKSFSETLHLCLLKAVNDTCLAQAPSERTCRNAVGFYAVICFLTENVPQALALVRVFSLSSSKHVRCWAAHTLSAIWDSSEQVGLNVFLQTALGLRGTIVQVLNALRRDKMPCVRKASCEAIAKWETVFPESFQSVIFEMLSADPASEVREEALNYISPQSSMDELLARMRDCSERVRVGVLAAVAKAVDNPRVDDFVELGFSDTCKSVKMRAALLLENIVAHRFDGSLADWIDSRGKPDSEFVGMVDFLAASENSKLNTMCRTFMQTAPVTELLGSCALLGDDAISSSVLDRVWLEIVHQLSEELPDVQLLTACCKVLQRLCANFDMDLDTSCFAPFVAESDATQCICAMLAVDPKLQKLFFDRGRDSVWFEVVRFLARSPEIALDEEVFASAVLGIINDAKTLLPELQECAIDILVAAVVRFNLESERIISLLFDMLKAGTCEEHVVKGLVDCFMCKKIDTGNAKLPDERCLCRSLMKRVSEDAGWAIESFCKMVLFDMLSDQIAEHIRSFLLLYAAEHSTPIVSTFFEIVARDKKYQPTMRKGAFASVEALLLNTKEHAREEKARKVLNTALSVLCKEPSRACDDTLFNSEYLFFHHALSCLACLSVGITLSSTLAEFCVKIAQQGLSKEHDQTPMFKEFMQWIGQMFPVIIKGKSVNKNVTNLGKVISSYNSDYTDDNVHDVEEFEDLLATRCCEYSKRATSFQEKPRFKPLDLVKVAEKPRIGVLLGESVANKRALASMASQLGAKVSADDDSLAPWVTHVVSDAGSLDFAAFAGYLTGRWVVPPAWLEMSNDFGVLVPEAECGGVRCEKERCLSGMMIFFGDSFVQELGFDNVDLIQTLLERAGGAKRAQRPSDADIVLVWGEGPPSRKRARWSGGEVVSWQEFVCQLLSKN